MNATDTEYLEAVRRGDIRLAQRMVDVAARDAGYTVLSWHGTHGDEFSVFDLSMGGEKTGAESAQLGIFSTDNYRVAKSYSENVGMGGAFRVALGIDPTAQKVMSSPAGKKLQKEIDNAREAFRRTQSEEMEKVEKQVRSELPMDRMMDLFKGDRELVDRSINSIALQRWVDTDQANKNERIQKVAAELAKLERKASALVLSAMVKKLPGRRVMRLRLRMVNPMVYDAQGKTPADFPLAEKIASAKRSGHDSVVFKNIVDPDESATHYVVFSPEQIKRADPATYDDAGKVIPLSRRFDSRSPDIRNPAKRSTNMTDTPEFKRWFAGSQVVDEKGRPLMVYHGTGTEISTFEPGRAGAIYFTPRKAHAEGYGPVVHDVYLRIRKLADLTDPRSDAYRLAVKVFNESGGWSWNDDAMEGRRHPRFDPKKDLTWEIFDSPENNVDAALLQAGYDGVKLQEYGGDVSYAVFDPTQIKSATGNRGTFDPTDPDIRNPLRGDADCGKKNPMNEGLTANQINAHLRKLGIRVRVLRGKGYYYWSDDRGNTIDSDSVYVYRASDLPLDQWIRLARDAEDSEKKRVAETRPLTVGPIRIGRSTNPVKPRRDESEREFISRCMSEEKLQFPKQKQRLAVCFSKARPNPLVPDDTNRKAASMSV